MPNPNPNNPLCPYCQKPMAFNGQQTSGAYQYRCRRGCKNENGKTPTATLSDRPAKRLGKKSDKAKSQKQREAEWKERDPVGYAEYLRKKRKALNERRKAERKSKKSQK